MNLKKEQEQENGGIVYVVGTGPGSREEMSFKARKALQESSVIVGYSLYLDLIEDLLEGKEVIRSTMRKEIPRCQSALDEARRGKKVALVSGGDPGVYGMAGILLQMLEKVTREVGGKNAEKIEVEIVAGITSASAAAASLGAPLMHDFVVISLSDLLTPWDKIEQRLRAAAEGDFVVVLYNPRSKKRQKHLERAREILLASREKHTPVGIVRNASRQEESKEITTLEELLGHHVDMTTTLIIGNSTTYRWRDKIITPRGYGV